METSHKWTFTQRKHFYSGSSQQLTSASLIRLFSFASCFCVIFHQLVPHDKHPCEESPPLTARDVIYVKRPSAREDKACAEVKGFSLARSSRSRSPNVFRTAVLRAGTIAVAGPASPNNDTTGPSGVKAPTDATVSLASERAEELVRRL